ncbi:MAG: AI-2E family transporter [Bacteroidales bacterium]|jgi:predicted PurR-regulated permease PerM|nr:AI-2E family transporter [Bacteroidales bacterium]
MASTDFNAGKFFRFLSVLTAISLVILLAWYFASVTVYVIIALIITLLCVPLKELLVKIRFRKIRLGNTLSTILSLTVVAGSLLILFRLVFIPVTAEVNNLLSIDLSNMETTYDNVLEYTDKKLKDYKIIGEEEDLQQIVIQTTLDAVRKINISSALGNIMHLLGSVFLGVFSVLFISFFFLKDFALLQKSGVNMMPEKHQAEGMRIIQRSKKLLSNYFTGLFVEMLLMGLLEFLILFFLGIENALLISFIGGVLVVIPFLGSLIACFAGCIIAVVSGYMISPDADIFIIILKVAGTFIVCRMLDNFFLQPFIASKSVKAHPLEIFLVVLLSGSLAGIPGMMLGIPAYTVLRIIAQEFFGYNNFVKTLTSRLGKENTDA